MGLTLEQIRTRDPYTLEITLAQPFGPFLAAIPLLSIVNPAVIKAHEQHGDWAEAWLAQHEAGSGAYQLVQAPRVFAWSASRRFGADGGSTISMRWIPGDP